MGGINYTLLNASVLNASRLNMTGETGKPGGGAGGYWPAGTPAAIRRSAVLWYDIEKQGATNETMAANPVLKDLSGHGHDATCYNFGWGGMSGIGGYSMPNLSTWIKNSKVITEIISDNKIKIVSGGSAEGVLGIRKPFFSNISIKFSFTELASEIRVYKNDNTSNTLIQTITEEGEYSFDFEYDADKTYNQILIAGLGTIEQLPQYPGALVSDGVDDYAYVDGLPLLDDFTFIIKRTINAQKKNSVGAVKGESGSWNANNAFGLDIIDSLGDYHYILFGLDNASPNLSALGSAEIVVGTPNKINDFAASRGDIVDNFPYLWLMGYSPSARFAEEQLYTFLLFDRTLTDEEIEWVKNNLIENNYTVEELDASLVDAWVFSGYRNEDAPATVTGERGRELSLRNFGYTAGSGFDGGFLVTDGVDDYGVCADFPIKDTYTLIMKFATLKGKLHSAACTTTYFEASGTRRNGISPIYISPYVPYATMLGRKKNVAASSELAAVWMNKEAFCGEAYDDTSGQYTPSEGQEGTVYVGKMDDRGYQGGYKFAYLAYYDKVMTAEEAEAEVAKLDALWEARKV